MNSLSLGSSSLSCSRIAYGCWRIAGNPEGTPVSSEREEHGRQAILAAYEAGYTLFDHADIYGGGEAERIFGKVLKEVPAMRTQIQITSKCGIRRHGDPTPDAPYRYDFSYEHIIHSCHQSLSRLGIETLDLYLLHRPDFLANPEEVARAFSDLKQAGKALHFGVSNFRPSQLNTLQKACPMPLLVNQVEISLTALDCLHDGTLDHCLENQITPLAWSPLGGGRLASTDPIDLRDPDHVRRLRLRETLDLVARNLESSRPVIALSWLLSHPSHIVPVIGATNPERIRELAKAEDVKLGREDWYRLLESSLNHRLP